MGEKRTAGPRFITAADLEALERFRQDRRRRHRRLIYLGLVEATPLGWNLTMRGQSVAEERFPLTSAPRRG